MDSTRRSTSRYAPGGERGGRRDSPSDGRAQGNAPQTGGQVRLQACKNTCQVRNERSAQKINKMNQVD